MDKNTLYVWNLIPSRGKQASEWTGSPSESQFTFWRANGLLQMPFVPWKLQKALNTWNGTIFSSQSRTPNWPVCPPKDKQVPSNLITVTLAPAVKPAGQFWTSSRPLWWGLGFQVRPVCSLQGKLLQLNFIAIRRSAFFCRPFANFCGPHKICGFLWHSTGAKMRISGLHTFCWLPVYHDFWNQNTIQHQDFSITKFQYNEVILLVLQLHCRQMKQFVWCIKNISAHTIFFTLCTPPASTIPHSSFPRNTIKDGFAGHQF